MCEFNVLKLDNDNKSTKKIAEDVMFMNYDKETGKPKFADILGRPVGSSNAFITEINMFESRHDITFIESDLVPLIAKFMYAINSTNKGLISQSGQSLIEVIQQKLK
jgi:hypothetical protein